ncbi:hypothetical protein [Microbacterium sp. NPDC096154]|uniref:hypothetical protein n=1 Tax=Microbacterium sp. NPDC096154 TaxID=3155549 RepID=UPI0033169BDE
MYRDPAGSFAALLLRSPRTLTDDERTSLRFYLAYVADRGHQLRRETRWLRQFEIARDALVRDQALPSATVAWLKNQRRADSLCAFQVQMLEQLPGWRWCPRHGDWHARADALAEYMRLNRRAPRVRSHDAAERSLAIWLGRQLRAMRSGRLAREKADRLVAVLTAGYGAGRSSENRD